MADNKRAILDVVSAAAAPSTNTNPRVRTKAPAAKGPARKRSRQIHDTQVRLDFFSEQELADNYTPPTDLISRMNGRAGDFYDNPYQDEVDVSFANLPPERRYEMLEGLSAAAGKVEQNTIKATDADPTAICTPTSHTHDMMFLPTDFQSGTNPMEYVKEGHRIELSTLYAYEALETFATEHEYYGGARMTVTAFLSELDACFPHGIQQRDERCFIIFELGRHYVFFAAVEVDTKVSLLPKEAENDYASWTLESMEGNMDKVVMFKGRSYFECPCV